MARNLYYPYDFEAHKNLSQAISYLSVLFHGSCCIWYTVYHMHVNFVTRNLKTNHLCFSDELDLDDRISFLLEEYKSEELAEIIVRFSTDHVRQVKTLNDRIRQLEHEIK